MKGLPWDASVKLGDVQRAIGASLEDMVKLVETTFREQPYTKEEVAKEFKIPLEVLEGVTLEKFKLKQRARHVYKGKCFFTHHNILMHNQCNCR